jgi:prepilin-type N-terminal cleavage/methylation domain-containing protein
MRSSHTESPETGNRAGFTLAELAVVILILGILAGLALPNLRSAIHKADAAHVISDAHTVIVAASEHLSSEGRFPSGAAPGSVPPELRDLLPDNFEFRYKGATYMWWGFTLPTGIDFWGSRHIGIFMVSYGGEAGLARAMKAHRGTNRYWSPHFFYIVHPG